MSYVEQCLNQLQLDLISLSVNLSCGLGFIISRFDFVEAIFEQYLNRLQFNLMLFVINCSHELDIIMTR